MEHLFVRFCSQKQLATFYEGFWLRILRHWRVIVNTPPPYRYKSVVRSKLCAWACIHPKTLNYTVPHTSVCFARRLLGLTYSRNGLLHKVCILSNVLTYILQLITDTSYIYTCINTSHTICPCKIIGPSFHHPIPILVIL
jgi:hypothetical protein